MNFGGHFLDTRLTENDIGPYKTMQGWVFFDSPKITIDKNRGWRFNLMEANGRVATIPIQLSTPMPNAVITDSQNGFSVGDWKDLSEYPLRYFTSGQDIKDVLH